MIDRAKLIAKIEKLRALANDPSGNANEREAAALKLGELMAEYQVSEIELGQRPASSIQKHKLHDTTGRVDHWDEVLLGEVSHLYRCRVCIQTKGSVVTYVLVGYSDDAAQAAEIYSIIKVQIVRQCERWYSSRGITPSKARRKKTELNSYCLGLAIGVTRRLKQVLANLRERWELSNSTALAVFDSRASEVDESIKGLAAARKRRVSCLALVQDGLADSHLIDHGLTSRVESSSDIPIIGPVPAY